MSTFCLNWAPKELMDRPIFIFSAAVTIFVLFMTALTDRLIFCCPKVPSRIVDLMALKSCAPSPSFLYCGSSELCVLHHCWGWGCCPWNADEKKMVKRTNSQKVLNIFLKINTKFCLIVFGSGKVLDDNLNDRQLLFFTTSFLTFLRLYTPSPSS
jgi:hypothetical protein